MLGPALSGQFAALAGVPASGGTFTGQVLFADGTQGAPGIAFAGAAGTGIWRNTSNGNIVLVRAGVIGLYQTDTGLVFDLPSSFGSGLTSTGSGTGSAIVGTGVDGYGVVAASDTTSPAKAAFRLVPQDTDPSSPTEGDVYYNGATHLLKFYNGTAWKTIVVL